MTVPEPIIISVVTPSFQQGRYVGDALVSVQGQSPPFEHVVFDGGSTDDTLDALRRSNAIWESMPDKGQSDAVNRGLQTVAGDIIGWLNADDFYLAGAFDAVRRYFRSHPEVDVCYGDCVFVDANTRLIRAKCEHHFCRRILLNFGCYVPTTATFFRRRLLDKGLLRLDESKHWVMDYELFLRLSSEGCTFGYLPRVLAAFRYHDTNKSLDDSRRWAERLDVERTYLPRLSDLQARRRFSAYRGLHIVCKAIEGSVLRQATWALRKGRDMRWWS